MTDDPTTPPDESPVDDVELGAPVEELGSLTLRPDDQFGRRVHSQIERRVLAGELLDLARTAPMLLFELLRAPFELLGGKRRK